MKNAKVSGIHHVAIKCRGIQEFEKTVSFYRDILGFSVLRSWGEGERSAIMLESGSGLLEIFANAFENPSVAPIRHIALAAESTDACIEAVRKAGYKITVEPKDICIPSDPPCPARIAFCIGAAGEEIEFFESK